MKWNRKCYLTTKNIRTKIQPASIDDMEDDDRKILEMFNCFKDSFFISGDNLPEDMNFIYEKRKRDKKSEDYIKKNLKKKRIFKIEKINKNTIYNNSLDINDPSFIHDFEIFNKEILNMIAYNEKIVYRLFDCETIEENQRNLYKWIENNPKFEENSYFKNLDHEPFIKKMEEILNTWNRYEKNNNYHRNFTDLSK